MDLANLKRIEIVTGPTEIDFTLKDGVFRIWIGDEREQSPPDAATMEIPGKEGSDAGLIINLKLMR